MIPPPNFSLTLCPQPHRHIRWRLGDTSPSPFVQKICYFVAKCMQVWDKHALKFQANLLEPPLLPLPIANCCIPLPLPFPLQVEVVPNAYVQPNPYCAIKKQLYGFHLLKRKSIHVKNTPIFYLSR